MAIDYEAPNSRIIVIGLCMQLNHYFPAKALWKEWGLNFAYVYSKDDFLKAIRFIGGRRIDPSALVTSRVDLSSLPSTFERLKKPGSELKVMLKPSEIFLNSSFFPWGVVRIRCDSLHASKLQHGKTGVSFDGVWCVTCDYYWIAVWCL